MKNLGAVALLTSFLAVTFDSHGAPQSAKASDTKSFAERQVMVPDDDSVLIAPTAPRGGVRKTAWVTYTFHVFVTEATGKTDASTPGENCTGVARQAGDKVRLFTAAHCFILPRLRDASQVVVSHDTAPPREDVFDLKQTPVVLSESFSKRMRQARANPEYTAQDHSIDQLVDDIAYPTPIAESKSWPDDWAYVELPANAWRWQVLTAPPRSGELKGGDTLVLAGGGCTVVRDDCYTKRATGAYPIYAHHFTVDGTYGASRATLREDGDAQISFGDSGGPARVQGSGEFVGIISGFMPPTDTAPPRVVIQRLTGM